ncbi:MAG: Sulfite exporter TauE/SafE/YfcA [Thermodesulfobacterium sp.]|uniref:Probable membrane transporter protein n=1 Tax=Candidatus Thermodesulfobacterium syntrophicum TaxID=3060442 RepID=A0AAE3P0N0_9BACT|nr:Sulfite exporter TauE/SafE/YfcA [Candidatus Thermodesulfobacterium syntrophicum]
MVEGVLNSSFIDINLLNALYLIFVGFVGGLVSGFIGSGGAFILTPSMMSLGVPGLVAVASNMCHKFPKALVGAIKRAKFGQVDLKLGLIMGASAEAGVMFGAHIQEYIKKTWGNAGSSLYVSLAFVVILSIVGTYVLWDALKSKNQEIPSGEFEKPDNKIIRFIHSIRIPGTMVYFPSIGKEISVLLTIPLGFATGMLAATIAVGGFIGVPSMIYILGAPALKASATELVIAFVMGAGGSFKYAWSGFVDVRLSMLILLGSLFGVQLGAIGTTYVKDYMIKFVMGTIMLIILVSRGLMIPVYLHQLNVWFHLTPEVIKWLKILSFAINFTALLTGCFIVLGALIKGIREERAYLKKEAFYMAEERKF